MPQPDKEYQVGKKKFEKHGDRFYEVKESPHVEVVSRREVTPWILKLSRQALLDALGELEEVLTQLFPNLTWDVITEPVDDE